MRPFAHSPAYCPHDFHEKMVYVDAASDVATMANINWKRQLNPVGYFAARR